MAEQKNNAKLLIVGFCLIALILLSIVWVIQSLFSWIASLNSDLAVALVTVSGTILVSTLTIVLSQHYARKKEAENHLREKKIAIYNDFLKRLWVLFNQSKNNDKEQNTETDDDLVAFLREFQRSLIVWSSPEVIKSFTEWLNHLINVTPNAKTMFLMEDFFKAMRRDIGHSNIGLKKGAFFYFILTNASLFIKAAAENPDITMNEMIELEKKCLKETNT